MAAEGRKTNKLEDKHLKYGLKYVVLLSTLSYYLQVLLDSDLV